MSDEFIAGFMQDVIYEAAIAASEPPRRSRTLLGLEDPFELRDAQFKKHFRLNKELTEILMNIIEPVVENRTHLELKTKEFHIPSSKYIILFQVLCALNFFGTGSYQTPVGNLKYINISQPSTSRCISEVVDALNHPTVFHQWVKFPSTIQDLNSVARDFYRAFGFPGVIGCIDCTHVSIVPPGPPFEEHTYVNRKNYHSVNTQLICDSKLKILNVNALFPGSTHDCYIWNNSRVLPLLENLHAARFNNFHLIGDSSYPLRPWCLTPILQAEEGTAAFRYNETLKKTRATIERCNGVLKGRFRCLLKDRVLHYAPTKATQIINACCVLHNICIAHNYNEAVDDVADTEELGLINNPSPPPLQDRQRQHVYLAQGRQKQTQLINTYFN